tara:strand:- start:92 stop:280 length:189 start_codon:yes stop_codon:yes gene_type:complete
MDQIINNINQQIAVINQAIALAKATDASNPLSLYLDKPAMIAKAKTDLQSAVAELTTIANGL